MSITQLFQNDPLPSEEFIVWLTGLSGSGKSTLASLLAHELFRSGVRHELLDGDQVRTSLCRDLGFTPEHRDENVRRSRDEARKASARFFEIHVECPLPVLIQRDVKGLYRRALEGRLPHFTGIADPYEPPLAPELRLRTDRPSKEQCFALILQQLERRAWLPPALEEGKGDPAPAHSRDGGTY